MFSSAFAELGQAMIDNPAALGACLIGLLLFNLTAMVIAVQGHNAIDKLRLTLKGMIMYNIRNRNRQGE